jgi:hypothetical protein
MKVDGKTMGILKKTQNPCLSPLPPNPREKNQALDAFSLAT